MRIISPRPKRLHYDYETFSELDLRAVGVSRYARDPSTRILMCAYKTSESRQIGQWVPEEGDEIPAELEDALADDRIQKWAWNAVFELQIGTAAGLPVTHTDHFCTMVAAMYLSYPGKLEKAGKAMGMDESKLKNPRGQALIRKFSKPNKPSKKNPTGLWTYRNALPEWDEFLDYNVDDVIAECSIYARLEKWLPGPEFWEEWRADYEINSAGLPMNRRMVENCDTIYNDGLDHKFRQMKKLTGLKNPNSTAQLLPWLQDEGYRFEDLKAAHVKREKALLDEAVTTGDAHPEEIELLWKVLELRADTSLTSIKKFDALLRAMDEDDNLRFVLQFYGAQRTGRWAGRIYQPQNLPRPDGMFEKHIETWADMAANLTYRQLDALIANVFELLKAALRPAAQAPEGYVFLDADLNAIENRVLGWMARCMKILRVFEQKRDPYIDFATYLFGQPYDRLWHEYKVEGKKEKRTISKPGVLGCGYMLGEGDAYEDPKTGEIEATGLLGYAWGMGIRQFTKEQSSLSVQVFRREFVEVKELWFELERAMRRCIQRRQTVDADRVRFEWDDPFVRMVLPSGRSLFYADPQIKMIRAPWGDMKPTITYKGLNDKKMWGTINTHPGKITENGDQAISRDLLMHGIMLARKRGIDVRLHVHDQIVGLAKEDKAEQQLAVLIDSMEERPKWAQDLPLGSEGFISKVMKKD